MRLSIERVCGIRMRMPCHEDLMAVVLKGIRIGLLNVAVQTDVSKVTSKGFVIGKTEIPQDEKDGAESLPANSESCLPSQRNSKCNTIKWEHAARTREYLLGRQRADVSLKVILHFKEASAVTPD